MFPTLITWIISLELGIIMHSLKFFNAFVSKVIVTKGYDTPH